MSVSKKALSDLVAAIQERQRIGAEMEAHLLAGRLDEYNALGRPYLDADAYVRMMEKKLQDAHRHDGIA